jgi:hypothetical protein
VTRMRVLHRKMELTDPLRSEKSKDQRMPSGFAWPDTFPSST